MILDIKEKNRGELNRLRRKLRIKPDGETEAMDNVGKYFLREISEEAKERVRVLMIERDAVDTYYGYRNTHANVESSTYATITTPRYIRTLSAGRGPYYVSPQTLEPWVIRRIFSAIHPDTPRYRADFDQTEEEVVRETARDISHSLLRKGTHPRRFFADIDEYLNRTKKVDKAARLAFNRFWD